MSLLAENPVSGRFTGMSLEFAYQFRQATPRSGFKDLDDVVLTAAVMSDDGDTIPAGSEGTIVSVHGAGDSFVVEFAEPAGALATVMPYQMHSAPNAAV